MVSRLAHPEQFSGKAQDGVEVVIPSMPGYDLSSPPYRPIGPKAIAGLYAELMVLSPGYSECVVHGGDRGSYVVERLAFDHGDHCVAIHLTMISVRHYETAPKSEQVPPAVTEEEKVFTQEEMQRWDPQSLYARLQSNVPMELGYAMADSPFDVAAGTIEAFHAWSDLSDGKRSEDIYSFDDLLNETMLYLVTNSFHSST